MAALALVIKRRSQPLYKETSGWHVMTNLLVLALLCATIFDLTSATATPKCTRPSLRKEWRELGYDGQKAFADAIKVLSNFTLLSYTERRPSLIFSVYHIFLTET